MNSFFDTQSFMPHGMCIAWRPEILWTHVISDLVIFFSYLSIPLFLLYFIRVRASKDVIEFKPLLLLFSAFICLCGITHLMAVRTIWVPDYQLEALFKLMTAIMSLLTVIYLFPVLPKLVALPNPALLQEKNAELQQVIAERDKAEQELARINRELKQQVETGLFDMQNHEARMQVLIDTMVDGVIIMDNMATVLAFNPACEQLFWYHAQEVIGHNINMLMPSPYKEHHDNYISNYLSTGEKRIIGIGREVSGQRSDGSVFPMELSVGEVRQAGNSLFVGVIRDISERKASEQALRNAKHKAETANQAKSMFLANMSHEIRTPMNAVLGYAQLLGNDESLPPQHRRSIAAIQNAGQHLLNIINDILSLSKIEAGMMTLNLSDFDLSVLMQELADVFALRCEQKNLDWQVDIQLSQQRIHGDQGKLRQVLINLIGNAVKFTDHGYVKLSITQHGDQYTFSVEDSGPGIPTDEQERLFSAFQQGQSGVQKGGSGLGLALCKRLLEHMKGSLTLDSEPGRGSRFSFNIGFGSAHKPEREPPQLANRHLPDGCHISALIVDDALDNLDILEQMLTASGIHVVTSHRPDLVLPLLANNPVHIALLDIRMPQLNGTDLMRQIKHNYPGIVCVAVTASLSFDMSKQTLLELGFDHLICKPYQFDDVYAVFEQKLGIHFIEKSQTSAKIATASALPPLPTHIKQSIINATQRQRLTELENLIEELKGLPSGEAWRQVLRGHLDKFDMVGIIQLLEKST